MAKKRSKRKPKRRSKTTSPHVDNDNFDKRGKFAKGNQVNKGRKNATASRVQKLKQAMLNAVSEKDLETIIKKQVAKAKRGNTCAANIVLDRCLGKPLQSHKHTGEDDGPIQFKFTVTKTYEGKE